jgi:hypothetical protein
MLLFIVAIGVTPLGQGRLVYIMVPPLVLTYNLTFFRKLCLHRFVSVVLGVDTEL